MGWCDGWSQAIAACEREIDHGNFAGARHNLLAIKTLVAVFATPEALAQIAPAQRAEVRGLLGALAQAWRRLARAASAAAAEDRDRLAG